MASSGTHIENNVGILAMEVYFPSTYVKQTELETANGVSAGKYTLGLNQDAMAFTGDLEDVNSISLTVVQSLLEKYSISPTEVGRLEVGTESLVDKSKSTKTVLMSLFAESGNTDIEGATVVNACYGGTAALLNALSWVDSGAWDGRFAIVVAADIAVYADGPARPTGGCGSVAMLIGRNAPLAVDLRTRTTHATHVWDFFKPNLDSEYPEVNGALSQTCYLRALDDCYTRFVNKSQMVRQKDVTVGATDYFLFHSPYNKLVQKSFARLMYQDMLSGAEDGASIEPWKSVPPAETYEDKGLESALKGAAGPKYKEKVAIGCELSKNIGNAYTASVWMNLANLVSSQGASLDEKGVVLFSYGSGALASMISIIPTSCNAVAAGTGAALIDKRFSLKAMQKALDIPARLQRREALTPEDLAVALTAREASHGFVPFRPTFSVEKLTPGTFYLQSISAQYERIYTRKPLEKPQVYHGPLVMTRKMSNGAVGSSGRTNSDDLEDAVMGLDIDDDDDAGEENGRSDHVGVLATTTATTAGANNLLRRPSSTGSNARIKHSVTQVWASGRPNVNVVVTGVAAALPGRDHEVFPPGVNNIRRIIDGESFISAIPDVVKDAMLEKNVRTVSKAKDGSVSTTAIERYEQTINVCATLGKINLSTYGIPDSIVATMDRAVQVSIAAGLEALKDAGIVSGQGPGTSGWVLPEHLQNSTGVVYATSFPALDTAIAEVSKYFQSRSLSGSQITEIIAELRKKLVHSSGGALSAESESALEQLEKLAAAESMKVNNADSMSSYQFDRKFLFRVLVLGNAQLAQIIKARGPNMQTNAACAGATQAIALAYDMIQVGRAERVIVIAGDSASSDNLMPWLGNGFRILGAATICDNAKIASRPFNQARSGMILGSGGIGMVLESEDGARRRHLQALSDLEPVATASNPNPPPPSTGTSAAPSAAPVVAVPPAVPRAPFRCRLLGTLVSNSAYHGAAMDRQHIAVEMERFIASVEKEQGIPRSEIAKFGVYFSHETGTHASPASSCAANEIHGLREVFGEDLKNLLILNTKGFTGHPMGVSFEDVVAAEVLVTGRVPPMANYSEVDPNLGSDLKMSQGGEYPVKYAMRFAAGFGSQIALALYGL